MGNSCLSRVEQIRFPGARRAWLRERPEREDLRAVAAGPVRVGGMIRGALGFLDSAGRTFDDEELRRIGRLAGLLWLGCTAPGSLDTREP
jgi:hypothetical protein